MSDETRFENHENAATGRNGMGRNNDVTRGELASFHEFLANHDDIADKLSKNPSLASNKEFLENHSELSEYLQAHPQAREELNENPQAFVTASANFNGAMPKSNHTAKATTETKPK